MRERVLRIRMIRPVDDALLRLARLEHRLLDNGGHGLLLMLVMIEIFVKRHNPSSGRTACPLALRDRRRRSGLGLRRSGIGIVRRRSTASIGLIVVRIRRSRALCSRHVSSLITGGLPRHRRRTAPRLGPRRRGRGSRLLGNRPIILEIQMQTRVRISDRWGRHGLVSRGNRHRRRACDARCHLLLSLNRSNARRGRLGRRLGSTNRTLALRRLALAPVSVLELD